jgi:hypothetical protein
MQPGLFRVVLRLALATLLLHWQAFGKLVNVTIDDTLGDSRTGEVPAYLPEKVWTNSSVLCPSGTSWGQPPPSCARNNTWHATTSIPQAEWPDSSQLTLQFEGKNSMTSRNTMQSDILPIRHCHLHLWCCRLIHWTVYFQYISGILC